jgi:membrane-associated phospholipid phosphatase
MCARRPLGVAIGGLLYCASAGAEPSGAPAALGDPPYALKNTDARFLALELAAAASLVTINLVTREKAERCGWCSTNGFDRSVRRALLSSDPETAGVASRVISNIVAPALALTSVTVPALVSDHASHALADSVIVLNGALFTLGISETTKSLFDRRRPAFHYGVEGRTEMNDEPEEEFRSFISGDTALVFSLAASTATLSYLRGYESAPYVLAGGALLAVTTGVLRVAGDVHWATDALASSIVGTGSGMLVPLAFHGRETPSQLSIVPEASSERVGLYVGIALP